MNDLFSIIGSIASLVSIPLVIYLYLKSKEAKFDKLKKDISRILSYQIGDERLLSTFEIKLSPAQNYERIELILMRFP